MATTRHLDAQGYREVQSDFGQTDFGQTECFSCFKRFVLWALIVFFLSFFLSLFWEEGPKPRKSGGRKGGAPKGVKPRRLWGRRGFTRQPDNSKCAYFRVAALETTPRFHENTPREKKSENVGGRGKNEILGVLSTLEQTCSGSGGGGGGCGGCTIPHSPWDPLSPGPPSPGPPSQHQCA